MAAGRTELIRDEINEIEKKQRTKLKGIYTIEGHLKTVLVDANRNNLDHSKIPDLIESCNKIKASNGDIRKSTDDMDTELDKTIKILERTQNNGVEANAVNALRLDELKIYTAPVQEEELCAKIVDHIVGDPCVDSQRELEEEAKEDDTIEDKVNIERVTAGRKDVTYTDSGISTGSSIENLNDLNRQTGTGNDEYSIEDNTASVMFTNPQYRN